MSDAVVCDLDGVVYRGERSMPGAAEALAALDGAGLAVSFATNNSAREPAAVVDKLLRVVGYRARIEQVITSSLVAASLIEAGPVLIMGESGVETAVLDAGFELTEDPQEAATVVVGLDRHLSYARVSVAAAAVRAGARLIATNRDPTFPSETGLLPGAGACVAAVETAAGVRGVTAGKPSEAMRRLVEQRHPEGTIWMIGDRPDTDIALAEGARWRSILVLTGVTTSVDGADPKPDHVVDDLSDAARLILRERSDRAEALGEEPLPPGAQVDPSLGS